MSQGVPLVVLPSWLKTLYPDDPRRRWVNQVLADQARRIREKLEARKRQRVRNGADGSDFVDLGLVDSDVGDLGGISSRLVAA